MSKLLSRRLIDVDSKRGEGKYEGVALSLCSSVHNRNRAHNFTSPFSFMSSSDEEELEHLEHPPPLPPVFMPFVFKRDCSRRIQGAFGVEAPHINIPRAGDKSTTSDGGHDVTHVHTHMAPIPTASAKIIWDLVDDAVKLAPVDQAQAIALHQLANNAGYGPTTGMNRRIPHDVAVRDCFPVTVYQSVGGITLIGKESVPKLISFVYKNMDPSPHRVKWYNLTGREQCEWIEVWMELGQPHDRRANQTLGLRGTDILRIHTEAVLQQAMERSPTLVSRRPPEHPELTQEQFTTVNRNLFPDQDA